MRAAGFRLWRNHKGWASMGPLAAIPRIPKLLDAMLRTAFHIRASKPDLVVLVDFGVFNLALGEHAAPLSLRRGDFGSLSARNVARQRGEGAARELADGSGDGLCASVRHSIEALDAASSSSAIRLRADIATRPLRAAGAARRRPRRDAAGQPRGRAAPAFAGACRSLSHAAKTGGRSCAAFLARRTSARERSIARAVKREAIAATSRSCGASTAALADADAAWVSSGTAVLETALLGVPAVAIYVIPRILIWYGHRMIRHRFITLPNLVLGREDRSGAVARAGDARADSPTRSRR